jgi:hypothetical protein
MLLRNGVGKSQLDEERPGGEADEKAGRAAPGEA